MPSTLDSAACGNLGAIFAKIARKGDCSERVILDRYSPKNRGDGITGGTEPSAGPFFAQRLELHSNLRNYYQRYWTQKVYGDFVYLQLYMM